LFPIAEHDVYRFVLPIITANMYVLSIGDSCLVVDPFVSQEVSNLLCKYHIKDCLVLLTHEHLDHISGVNWLRGLFPCRVVCSETCGGRITDPRKSGAAYFDALFFGHNEQEQQAAKGIFDSQYTCQADWTYTGETEFPWQGFSINLRETPGHSPGSQMIIIDNKYLFTGDSLIPGQKVITRLPGGNRKSFEKETLPYLRSLPENCIIFPGHGQEMQYAEVKEVLQ